MQFPARTALKNVGMGRGAVAGAGYAVQLPDKPLGGKAVPPSFPKAGEKTRRKA